MTQEVLQFFLNVKCGLWIFFPIQSLNFWKLAQVCPSIKFQMVLADVDDDAINLHKLASTVWCVVHVHSSLSTKKKNTSKPHDRRCCHQHQTHLRSRQTQRCHCCRHNQTQPPPPPLGPKVGHYPYKQLTQPVLITSIEEADFGERKRSLQTMKREQPMLNNS